MSTKSLSERLTVWVPQTPGWTPEQEALRDSARALEERLNFYQDLSKQRAEQRLAAEAENARLREEAATGGGRLYDVTRERDAATARAEAAEAEVALLRKQVAGQYANIIQLCNVEAEHDALRAENERLRETLKVETWSLAAARDYFRDERDTLRAQVDAVRAECKKAAYYARVTAIVEELASAEDSVRHPHPVAINILNEAKKEELSEPE